MSINTPYAVKMTRKGEGKVEIKIHSTSLHKNNENVVELSKQGFEISDTKARTKGGLNFGAGAEFVLFVVGTDAQAKKLDASAYQVLADQEKPAEAPKDETPKEEPVKQAEIPQEVVKEETPARKRTKKVDSAE